MFQDDTNTGDDMNTGDDTNTGDVNTDAGEEGEEEANPALPDDPMAPAGGDDMNTGGQI